MEAESAKEWKRLVRMQEQDRISQASSLATISAFPVHGKGADGKVQTFGKRSRAVKRDPNCPVVIRGWLYKQDSSGLRLWKRRWFVLSDFCLFYYKDSREESVLGSIPLPSYNILFCSPRECKNRKYAFKAVHQGMRAYIFSADTQEDMLGWVRALSQSANMEMESSLRRRCSSYQDFTRIGGSSESLDLPDTRCIRGGATQSAVQGIGSQNGSSPLVGGRMATPQMERRGKQKSLSQSPSPRTSTPTNSSGQRRRGQSFTQETGEQDSLLLSHAHQSPPQTLKSTSPSPLTPRAHLGSRPHTPVGRVDIRPQDDPLLSPQSVGSAPPSPRLDFGPTSLTPTTEKRHIHNRHLPVYPSPHPISTARRSAGKTCSPGGQAGLLPPLPPPRIALVPPPSHHHHHHRSHLSLCPLPPAMSTPSELFQGRDQQQMRTPECEVDAVLTRLCGCDKLLQSLAVETAQLQADKENVHCALEMARLQLEEWKGEEFRGQGVRGQEELLLQKAVLQDDLVTIRARMCDVSMEMERVWAQYERMESELSVLRSHLQHICRFGRPQEQSQAQRELWMMEDILCGLKANRNYFRTLLRLPRQTVASPMLQKSVFHPGAPSPQADGMQNDDSVGTQSELPPRPPLPLELQGSNQDRVLKQGWLERESHSEVPLGALSPHRRAEQSGEHPSILSRDRKKSQSMPDTSPGVTGSIWSMPDTTVKRVRMSEEEQRERMKRNQERLANQKQAPTSSATNHSHSERPSPPREEPPFPLRVTRVLTAVLPTTLVARRVSVEDPPEELATPLPEQISPPEAHQLVPDQNRNPHRKHRELSLEAHQSSARVPKEVMKDKYDQNLPLACEEPSFHKADPKSDVSCPAVEVFVQSQPTTAVEDGKKIQKSRTCPASELQDVNETSITPEKSKTEPEKSPRPRRCEKLVSGNGGVPSDLRLRDEDACPAFTGNLAANEGRDKVRGRSSFLVSGRDGYPELCLTQEQRDAKLKRVERIRARVMRSAVRESSTQPSSLTGNPFDRLMKHSTATSEASGRLTGAGIDDTEECSRVEGADCADCCHSDKDPDPSINVTPELRPSRVSTLNALETEGNKQSKKSDLKKITQMHLECHTGDANNSCCHKKGGPGKHLISANHVTELIVFPANTNIGSTHVAGNCHPFHGVTKTVEEVTGDQNEASILPTNRRAEWFLSTNHITECIPTFGDHKNITTGFTIEHAENDPSAKTPLSAATGNADCSDRNTASAFPDICEPIEWAEKTCRAIHPSSPKNPSKHNHRSYLIKLASETEESDHFNPDVMEELTLFANEKVVELSTIQNEGAHKLTHYSNEERESLTSNGCEGQLTKPVTPCGEVNLASVASSVAGDNIEAIFSGKPQDPQAADPDESPTLCVKRISHSSPQSACELHIYEEIPSATTLRANQSQECPTSVNDRTSNPLVSRHAEHLPLNMSGHNASSSPSAETGVKTGNDPYTDVQADIEATDENPELSERMGEDAHLPEDQSKVDGIVRNGKDQKKTPFVKARVTVVRTSL